MPFLFGLQKKQENLPAPSSLDIPWVSWKYAQGEGVHVFILKVSSALERYGVPYAIVGGYAVALHGAVRGTVDVDLITQWELENLKLLERTLDGIGLRSRLPITPEEIFHSRDKLNEQKRLIAWNFLNPDDPSEQVDVLTTSDLGGVSMERISFEGKSLNIISKKCLIAMKEASGRKQDIQDAKALRALDET